MRATWGRLKLLRWKLFCLAGRLHRSIRVAARTPCKFHIIGRFLQAFFWLLHQRRRSWSAWKGSWAYRHESFWTACVVSSTPPCWKVFPSLAARDTCDQTCERWSCRIPKSCSLLRCPRCQHTFQQSPSGQVPATSVCSRWRHRIKDPSDVGIRFGNAPIEWNYLSNRNSIFNWSRLSFKPLALQ